VFLAEAFENLLAAGRIAEKRNLAISDRIIVTLLADPS
jgi:hypothetical protein